jgi:hypothetical protein
MRPNQSTNFNTGSRAGMIILREVERKREKVKMKMGRGEWNK